MIYNLFHSEKLSALGLGNMRLPVKDGKIDEEKAFAIVDKAIKSGINYFDTAYRYHGGMSEPFIGKALSRYPRESWNLASKLPGHMMNYKNGQLGFQGYLSDLKVNNISEIFEDQISRCGTEYFDYYLLHNVSESSYDFYTNEEVGAVEYVVKQKELGRIRHLGFSSHGSAELIDKFLTKYEGIFEFVQIQCNYLDWVLQDAKKKYEVITKHGLSVWVMEPVRGGKLASLDEYSEKQLKDMDPDASIASWGFRFLQGYDNIKVILSGMTTMEQLLDNLKTFEEKRPLGAKENAVLSEIAQRLMNAVPCTACRYCCEECPKGLPIPDIIAIYNKYISVPGLDLKKEFIEFEKEKLPSNCIACGNCQNICPQSIDIPDIMKKLSEKL